MSIAKLDIGASLSDAPLLPYTMSLVLIETPVAMFVNSIQSLFLDRREKRNCLIVIVEWCMLSRWVPLGADAWQT